MMDQLLTDNENLVDKIHQMQNQINANQSIHSTQVKANNDSGIYELYNDKVIIG